MLKNTDLKQMQDAIDALEENHMIDDIDDVIVLRKKIRNSWEMNRLAIKMISGYHKVLDDILVRFEIDKAIMDSVKGDQQ